MSAFQRKYNASATINFPLITVDDTTFISSVSWGSTDIKVIKDEGTEADATNDPVHEGSGMWSLALTATELTAARVTVTIKNAAIEDQALLIETYGHASAQHAFDLDAATQTVAVGTGGIAATSFGANAITASALATDAVNEIVDQVWDEARSGHVSAGSFGEIGDADVEKGTIDIVAGSTDRYIYFVGRDSITGQRKTGLSGFTVYSSVDGDPAILWTTPTVNETDSTNMPGVYELLVDEDTTIGGNHDSEEMALHITASNMIPKTRFINLYLPKTTEGIPASTSLGGYISADVDRVDGAALDTHDAGKFPSDLRMVDGVALDTHQSGHVPSDARYWAGSGTAVDSNFLPNVNVAAVSADTGAAANLEADYDGTGYAKNASTIGTAGTATTVGSTGLDAISDAVWDEPTAGHVDAGSFGKQIADDSTTLSQRATPADVGTELATIHLDHLVSSADPGGIVANDSIIAKLVSKSGTAAFSDFDNTTDSLQAQADAGIKEGWFIETSVSDAGPAAGDFDLAAGLSASDDFYNRSTLIFTSGTLAGQQRVISDYVGSSRNVSFDGTGSQVDAPFPSAPGNGDTCVIVGRG